MFSTIVFELFSFVTLIILWFVHLASVEGWGYNTTRDTSQYILNNNLSAHIFPEHFCDHDSFLLVMVCSGPSNVEARNAIRETWGDKRNSNNVSLFFLLGETMNSSLQVNFNIVQHFRDYCFVF